MRKCTSSYTGDLSPKVNCKIFPTSLHYPEHYTCTRFIRPNTHFAETRALQQTYSVYYNTRQQTPRSSHIVNEELEHAQKLHQIYPNVSVERTGSPDEYDVVEDIVKADCVKVYYLNLPASLHYLVHRLNQPEFELQPIKTWKKKKGTQIEENT